MHPIRHCSTELPPIYLVWSAGGEPRVGELHGGNHQRPRDTTRGLVHLHLYMVRLWKKKEISLFDVTAGYSTILDDGTSVQLHVP